MAETLGLVASVVQVAGAGLKLSETLYQYADSVASADRRIKDVAKEIKLTASVIEELGDLFKQDATSTLLSKNALKTADETVQECSIVFKEVDTALKKSKKNTLGRLMLPFREPKIELLRSHVDKLKSTLQLLMQVLMHAYQVAAQKLSREAEAAQREQIKILLQNKKKSTKRYEESLRNYSMSEDSTVLDDGDDADEEDRISTTAGSMIMKAAAIKPTITVQTLETCVKHVQDLLSDIENLQLALGKQEDGADHSEHHQSLIGSYFRAREHLDGALLGSSAGYQPRNDNVHARVSLSTQTLQLRSETRELNILTKGEEWKEADMKAVERERAKAAEEERIKAAEEEQKKAAEKEQKKAVEEAHQIQLKAEQTAEQYQKAKMRAETSRKLEYEKAPVSFKDGVGRKFSFPFYLVSSWEGIRALIMQAFDGVDSLENYVHEGQYDLIDETGCIILPSTWAATIQPGAMITMRFREPLEQQEPAHHPPENSQPPIVLPPGVSIVDTPSTKPGGTEREGTPYGRRPSWDSRSIGSLDSEIGPFASPFNDSRAPSRGGSEEEANTQATYPRPLSPVSVSLSAGQDFALHSRSPERGPSHSSARPDVDDTQNNEASTRQSPTDYEEEDTWAWFSSKKKDKSKKKKMASYMDEPGPEPEPVSQTSTKDSSIRPENDKEEQGPRLLSKKEKKRLAEQKQHMKHTSNDSSLDTLKLQDSHGTAQSNESRSRRHLRQLHTTATGATLELAPVLFPHQAIVVPKRDATYDAFKRRRGGAEEQRLDEDANKFSEPKDVQMITQESVAENGRFGSVRFEGAARLDPVELLPSPSSRKDDLPLASDVGRSSQHTVLAMKDDDLNKEVDDLLKDWTTLL